MQVENFAYKLYILFNLNTIEIFTLSLRTGTDEKDNVDQINDVKRSRSSGPEIITDELNKK